MPSSGEHLTSSSGTSLDFNSTLSMPSYEEHLTSSSGTSFDFTSSALESGYDLTSSSGTSLDLTSSALEGGYDLSTLSGEQLTSSSWTSNSSSHSMDDTMMLNLAHNVVCMNYFYNYIYYIY